MAGRSRPRVLCHEPIPGVQPQYEDPIDVGAGFPVRAVMLLLALCVVLTGTTVGRWYGWGWGLAAAFLAVSAISVVLALFACLASGMSQAD